MGGGLQLSPSPYLSGGFTLSPHSCAQSNSSWNLLKSITDLWSQPPQRSSARRAGGLNRNELARGGFATLCVPASPFPFLSFYLTFIIIFFPLGSQLGRAKIRLKRSRRSQSSEPDSLCSSCKVGHGGASARGLLVWNSSHLAKVKIKQNEKPIKLDR